MTDRFWLWGHRASNDHGAYRLFGLYIQSCNRLIGLKLRIKE